MPRQKETAEIEVNGGRYRDWKSVSVDRRFGTIEATFSFDVASPIESAPNWAGLKLAIGDSVMIYLAGRKVLTGIVRQRQPAYDHLQHALRIGGSSTSGDVVQASVEAKPGEYKNASITQIFNSVLAPHGIKFRTDGDTEGMDKPFERVNLQVGEDILGLIDRLCRMRNVFLVDDVDGDIVGYRLPKDAKPLAELEEGRNIKSASAVFDYRGSVSAVEAKGQNTGNDERFGDDARGVSAIVKNPAVTRNIPRVLMMEMPGDNKDAEMRARHEMATLLATQLNVQVVVQGWHMDDGALWLEKVGQTVSVYSPMLFTNDRLDLAIEGVTSSQSEAGTISTLSLTLPGRLHGRGTIEGRGPIPQIG